MLLFDWMKDSEAPFELVKQLVKFNIEIEIIVVPIADVVQIKEQGNYDLTYIYSGVSAPEPIVELVYLSQHLLTDLQYNNLNFLDLLEKTKTEPDQSIYTNQVKELHRMLLESYRIIPLFHTRMVYLSNSPFKVSDPDSFGGSLDLWSWTK